MKRKFFGRFRKSRNTQQAHSKSNSNKEAYSNLLSQRSTAQPNDYCRGAAEPTADLLDVSYKDENKFDKGSDLIVNIGDQQTTACDKDIDLTLEPIKHISEDSSNRQDGLNSDLLDSATFDPTDNEICERNCDSWNSEPLGMFSDENTNSFDTSIRGDCRLGKISLSLPLSNGNFAASAECICDNDLHVVSAAESDKSCAIFQETQTDGSRVASPVPAVLLSNGVSRIQAESATNHWNNGRKAEYEDQHCDCFQRCIFGATSRQPKALPSRHQCSATRHGRVQPAACLAAFCNPDPDERHKNPRECECRRGNKTPEDVHWGWVTRSDPGPGCSTMPTCQGGENGFLSHASLHGGDNPHVHSHNSLHCHRPCCTCHGCCFHSVTTTSQFISCGRCQHHQDHDHCGQSNAHCGLRHGHCNQGNDHCGLGHGHSGQGNGPCSQRHGHCGQIDDHCGQSHGHHFARPACTCRAWDPIPNKRPAPSHSSSDLFSNCCPPPKNEFLQQIDSSLILFTISGNARSDCAVKLIELRLIPKQHSQEKIANRPTRNCLRTQPTWMPRGVRPSKRHLEETNEPFAFGDCQLHCEDQKLAPAAVTFSMTAPEELSRCPCCRRLVRIREDRVPLPISGGREAFVRTGQPSSDKYSFEDYYDEDNQMRTMQANFLGQFELSSKSYKKLISHCRANNIISSFPIDSFREGVESFCRNPRKDLHHFLDIESKQSNLAGNLYSNVRRMSQNLLVERQENVNELCKLAQVLETAEECPWYWGEVSSEEAKQLLRGASVGTFLLRDSSDPRFLFSLSLVSERGPTSIRIVYSDGVFFFDHHSNPGRSNTRLPSRSSSSNSNRNHRQCIVNMILHYTKLLTVRDSLKSRQEVESIFQQQKHAPSSTISTFQSFILMAPSMDISKNGNFAARNIKESRENGFTCSFTSRAGKEEISVVLSQPLPKEHPTLKQMCRTSLSKYLTLWKFPERIQQVPLPIPLKNYLSKYPYPV